jgi:hypothetical protein
MANKKLSPAPQLSIEQLVIELAAFKNNQERIDRVAEDYSSGENRYAEIDAWELGELLGLDFHDTGDWGRNFYGLKENLDDLGDAHPFADHLALIKAHLKPERYTKLSKLVEEIGEDENKPDLPLTKKEIRLIKDAYAESNRPDSPVIAVATTFLCSTGGEELTFEVCIGCGGDPCDAMSPYDLDRGLGFDSTDYIEID